MIYVIRHDNPEEVFICDCGDLEHIISFVYFKPSSPTDEDVFYVQFLLYNWRNFFQRGLIALKYLFGKETKNGIFDCVMFRANDMDRLVNVLSAQVGLGEENAEQSSISLEDEPYQLQIKYTVLNFDDDISPELTAEVFFKPCASYLRRLWRGFRYLLGYTSRYGRVANFEMSPEKTKVLKALALRYKSLTMLA